jgi:hypothetical protein
MIEELKNIADFLSSDPLTVEQIAQRIGIISQDQGSNVLVLPSSPFFISASVVREIDLVTLLPIDEPASVHLIPSKLVPLAQLSDTFGPYVEGLTFGRNSPERIFSLKIPGKPCSVVLIARCKDEGAVELTLRRDKLSSPA